MCIEIMRKHEAELLKVKLEASELKFKVKELEEALLQIQEELKLQNKLLRKQRLPKRPFSNSSEKQMIAARQSWKCAGLSQIKDAPECPMAKITRDGRFDQSLYIIDHVEPYSRGGNHTLSNRVALCQFCSAYKTRYEIANRLHGRKKCKETDESSDNEEE